MTIKECRRYLRKWRQTETSLNRLKTEKRVIEETIQALYELTLIPADGQPHGNQVTHPTEDKALRIIELMHENEHRTEDIDRRICKAEMYLKKVELVMTVAKNSGLLAINNGTTVNALCKLNGIKPTTTLKIGRKIRVR